MTISFECPSCMRRLKVPDNAAGRSLKCPACESRVEVPSEQDDLFAEPGQQALPPRRGKKKPARRPPETEAAPESRTGTKSRHPAVIPVATAVCGILLGCVIVWLAFGRSGQARSVVDAGPTTPDAEEIPDESTPAADTTADTAEDESSVESPTETSERAAAAERDEPVAAPAVSTASTNVVGRLSGSDSPAAAMKEMTALLKKRDYEGFILIYSPVELLRMYRDSQAKSDILGQFPGDKLLNLVQELAGVEPTLDSMGLVATVKKTATASAPTAPADGYGSDLPAVLDAAIADIEAGRIRDFVLKIFPSEAIRLMKAGPQGQTRLDAINAKSTVVTRMLDDLKMLKSATPQIDGDIAEYTVSPIKGGNTSAIRPNSRGLKPPDRRVRFSRINGHWRFFAGIGAAQLSKAQSGLQLREIQFERIGPSWRLKSMPRL